jgi:ferredoxin/DMSO/TMAO reductase YedYZ heme-binding membrane subunit
VPTHAESMYLVTAGMGFVSFTLLWVAVLTGFLLRNAWTQTWVRRPTLHAVHHTAAVMGLCLAIFHGVAHAATPGGAITLVELVVPFIDFDDPIGIGAGVLALELLIGIALSVAIQRRLGYARWRALHLVTYAAFILVVGHVLISGRDLTRMWVWVPILVAWLTTVLLWATTTPLLAASQRWLGGLRDRGPSRAVTIRVDARLCTRFGFCEHVAPQVFRLAADGQLSYPSTVPIDQYQHVMRAIEACPTRAISLGERPREPIRAQAEAVRPGRPVPMSPWAVPGVRRRNEILR